MKKLVFATTNKFKLKDAREILPIEIESADVDIEEIQETDVEKVVVYKALRAYEAVKKPVFVEDTGLYFNALNGFPGALIKSLISKVGTDGSLKSVKSRNSEISRIISDFSDRTAYAKTSIAYTNSSNISKVITTSGVINGIIVNESRGKNGFGWDDIFLPDGYDKTFAEMTDSEKNQISMRKQALMKLKEILNL